MHVIHYKCQGLPYHNLNISLYLSWFPPGQWCLHLHWSPHWWHQGRNQVDYCVPRLHNLEYTGRNQLDYCVFNYITWNIQKEIGWIIVFLDYIAWNYTGRNRVDYCVPQLHTIKLCRKKLDGLLCSSITYHQIMQKEIGWIIVFLNYIPSNYAERNWMDYCVPQLHNIK